MGKISPVAAKYMIHAQIQIEGVVDRPDVIGSVFGQTEGLLGSDLELRELQRSGRIGRIEVDLDTKTGKSVGYIIIPSSLDKTETVLIAAALETIQRIGPCNAKVKVDKVEDVRTSKRAQVIERAKALLSQLTHGTLPDSKDIREEVEHAVRTMGIIEWGPDRLPAGPGVDESEELIIVEGRADVLNLLKADFKNVIALNGTSVPPSIAELCHRKTVTVFVDGDRGGDLIIKELSLVTEIDFVTKAPDGKEVEELAKKEIHKALRSRVAIEQVRMELNGNRMSDSKLDLGRDRPQREVVGDRSRFEARPPQQERRDFPRREERRPEGRDRVMRSDRPPQREMREERAPMRRPSVPSKLEKKDADNFKKMLDDLVGTRGAYIVDENANILGKVPTTELTTTMESLTGSIYAVVMDGAITQDVANSAQEAQVKYLIANESQVRPGSVRLSILTGKDLQ
ncbi:MAG: DNA primase DnaG [Candidatus Woesearchaeota archaeon]|nr:DNA primase DnaG [Candidatus Woesearchaeota archaeon]